ncbi:hypothetical protein DOTSEDRAFT_22259 [Dothistroma septosporum NZE10]|uniref:Uncharacterized protein n=1 Tax=Dothistroma septosporum (strain NZE10 / CBS 128990) TaxID=675120 RepID=N1PUS2_DOTSN|nr:hypothetical protein DOTSEDRAFT_22259 [Dothistroma septosporum NZE10]
MTSGAHTARAAADQLQQTHELAVPDGSSPSRSAMVDTVEQNLHEIAAESFIAANLADVDTRNADQNAVYHGMKVDITAEKCVRGLTSQHFSAMQDKAMTGNFAVLSKVEYEPDSKRMRDSDEENKENEEEVENNSEEEEEEPRDDSEVGEDGAAAYPATATTGQPKGAIGRYRTDSNDERFDVKYVEAHPQENFTHKGKGSWKRGLPGPGDNIKSGVRGPGAAGWRKANIGK